MNHLFSKEEKMNTDHMTEKEIMELILMELNKMIDKINSITGVDLGVNGR